MNKDAGTIVMEQLGAVSAKMLESVVRPMNDLVGVVDGLRQQVEAITKPPQLSHKRKKK